MEIEARHGSHHTINIKYGYVLFGISVLYALLLLAATTFHLRLWAANGKPRPGFIWARVASIQPLWIHVLGWTLATTVVSFFAVHDLAENYSTVLKRVGRLGFCLVPLDVLLAMRPSLLTLSYLEHIALHKWISRLILLAVSVHGIGYFIKWLGENAFWRKSLKTLNFLGVVVFIFGVVLAVISVRPLRQRLYRSFYVIHNATIFLFVSLTFWHARPGITDFIILSWAMLGVQLYLKLARTYAVPELKVIEKTGSGLLMLKLLKPAQYASEWAPGSHVRLSNSFTDFRFWLFASHPFTIFSAPEDVYISLVIKKRPTFELSPDLSYTLSSPYVSLPAPFFQTAEKVVVLAGGSGISMGLPVFRYLSKNASVTTNLVWATSAKDDVFILDGMSLASPVDVYVTRNSLAISTDDTEQNDALLGSSENFEMETLTPLETELQELPSAEKESQGRDKIFSLHTGRPSLDSIFETLKTGSEPLNNWVVVCGPLGMIQEATQWGKRHNIQVFSEHYAF